MCFYNSVVAVYSIRTCDESSGTAIVLYFAGNLGMSPSKLSFTKENFFSSLTKICTGDVIQVLQINFNFFQVI